PYWYAQDMLASGAGRLVPFDDAAALAEAVGGYLEDAEALAQARAEARRIGSSLAWPAVAEATAAVLREAHVLAPRRRPAGVADGRSVWALGDILATAWIPAVVEPSRNLLDRLVGRLAGEVSLRTAAYSVLGLSRLDADRLNRPARRLLERLVEQLASAYERN